MLKNFLKKIRNKLFLNAIHDTVNNDMKSILENDIKSILKNDIKSILKNDIKSILENDIKSILEDDIKSILRDECNTILIQEQQYHENSISQFDLLKLEVKKEIVKENQKLKLNIGEDTSKFISAALLNRETFRPFKNFCKGKSIVICGAGPSLKDYIPIQNAVHIALNRAFLFDKVKFDFIFAQDYEGIMMVKDELREYQGNNCVKLFGKLFRDNVLLRTNFPESYISDCNAKTFATDEFYPFDLFKNHPFVAEIDSRAISCGTNVGLCVMQFAFWMNPENIYIVGCDHSGGHFSTQGLNNKDADANEMVTFEAWKNNLFRMRNQWKQVRTFGQVYYPETKIISVNPVGLKGIFTDLYQSTNTIVENECPPLERLQDSFIVEQSKEISVPDYSISENKCNFNIDLKEIKENFVHLSGWSYKENSEIDVYAKCDDKTYKARKFNRFDVQEVFDLVSCDHGFEFYLPQGKNITLCFVNLTEKVIYEANL